MADELDISKIPSTMKYAQEQQAGVDASMNNLVMEMRSQRDPLSVYTELEEAKGLPQQRQVAKTLREQISSVEDTIKRVEPNIKATTGQSMVTEAQRQGMVTAERKPLLERLGEFTTAYGRVSEGISAEMQDLSTKVSLYLQGQQMELEPLKLQYQGAVDKAARMTSAFSTDSQNQLNVLMANWNRKNELEDREYMEAFELLRGEDSYNKELKKIAASSGVTLKGNETTDQILESIGKVTAEELAYSRRKSSSNDSITFGQQYDWSSGDWEIVMPDNTGGKEINLFNYVTQMGK